MAQVAACTTAVGDIFITGNDIDTIQLTGLQAVYGDLRVNNTKALTFNAPTLQLVSGELLISDSTGLSNLNLAQLSTVGLLYLNALPELETTGLTTGITSADSITVANTGLTSLDGINVFKLKTLDVNNNDEISSFNLGLQQVTDSLSINYNSQSLEVKLNQLTSAKNVALQAISSVLARNLTSVNGSLSLTRNEMDSFDFPALTTIGNSLTIDENDSLEEFDFPQLQLIGGALNIIENEKLKTFSYFPKLNNIGGSVTLDGAFDNGTFPKLNKVAGGFNLTSTGKLSCDGFKKLNSNGDIKGDKFYCEGASSTISSSSSKSGKSSSTLGASSSGSDSGSSSTSSSGSSSSSSSSKKGAASKQSGKLSALVLVALSAVALY